MAFSKLLEKTDMETALAAAIFFRLEVPIEAVKDHMREKRHQDAIDTFIISVHKKGSSSSFWRGLFYRLPLCLVRLRYLLCLCE